jgi:hypothetical protein
MVNLTGQRISINDVPALNKFNILEGFYLEIHDGSIVNFGYEKTDKLIECAICQIFNTKSENHTCKTCNESYCKHHLDNNFCPICGT